jgi:hypothetical protein
MNPPLRPVVNPDIHQAVATLVTDALVAVAADPQALARRTVLTDGVIHGVNVGDWEIIVKRIRKP